MTTVLIIDDELDMCRLIEIMLTKSGFRTLAASNGQEAYAVLEKEQVDLILLDVMMPKEDGFQVCRNIRLTSDIPVIFLTARDANEDKVKGLTIGGDDYIIKPFTASELVARIHAVLRRAGRLVYGTEQKLLTRGCIKLDEISRKVTVNGVDVPLTLKEYELLNLFMQNPANVYSREQLLERVWNIEYSGGTRTVDTHIKTLRLKLGKQSKEASDYIQTVWGIGYRFEKAK
ncbi:MAG: response regulator transcription factor [Lysinibacillus sp.]